MMVEIRDGVESYLAAGPNGEKAAKRERRDVRIISIMCGVHARGQQEACDLCKRGAGVGT